MLMVGIGVRRMEIGMVTTVLVGRRMEVGLVVVSVGTSPTDFENTHLDGGISHTAVGGG